MSYATWQQKYGLDPTVIGASFTFNGFPYTVIGVAPPKFYGDRMENSPAFWFPLHAEAMIDGRAISCNLGRRIGSTSSGGSRQGLIPKALKPRCSWNSDSGC
jgi:hypothetical protein